MYRSVSLVNALPCEQQLTCSCPAYVCLHESTPDKLIVTSVVPHCLSPIWELIQFQGNHQRDILDPLHPQHPFLDNALTVGVILYTNAELIAIYCPREVDQRIKHGTPAYLFNRGHYLFPYAPQHQIVMWPETVGIQSFETVLE